MINKCTCGRSPTGNCVGWHKLSEEDYKKKKETTTNTHAIISPLTSVVLKLTVSPSPPTSSIIHSPSTS